MNCPKCNSINLMVKETMSSEEAFTYRKRYCKDCNYVFFTTEIIDKGTAVKAKMSCWAKSRVRTCRENKKIERNKVDRHSKK